VYIRREIYEFDPEYDSSGSLNPSVAFDRCSGRTNSERDNLGPKTVPKQNVEVQVGKDLCRNS